MTEFLNYLFIGITRGSMYSLIALGYTLVYGVLQLINFAHSEVFMSGAFGSYLIVKLVVGNGTSPTWAVPFIILLGAASGAVVASIIAWTLERVAYRPLRRRGAPKLAFLISAIGASFFLQTLASKLFNSQSKATNQFPEFFDKNSHVFSVDGARVTGFQLTIVIGALVMMIGLDLLVNRTKLGRSIRAVSEDAPTAALMGIDIDKTISRTFIIGGALGGVAGFLYGVYFGFGFNVGFDPGVKAFAAAVLGGIGNIRGAMIGGLLLGVVEGLYLDLPHTSFTANNNLTDVVAFLILVLVLMFRPTGILGERLGRAA